MTMLRLGIALPLFMMLVLALPPILGAREIPFPVAVSIPPLCDLVKQVGGERVTVVQLIPNGFNPHAYEPTPREVQAMSQAEAVFLVGLGFDTAFEKLLRGVDRQKPIYFASEGIEILYGEDHHHHDGEEGKFPDPHVWMSLRNAMVMVENIARFLSEIDPQGSSFYQKNAQAYREKLRELDIRFRSAIEKVENRRFIASHNAWSYLARDYALILSGVIEKAPDREPTPQELRELITTMRNEKVGVIFVEPQFNQKIAQTLAQETGGVLLTLDPLGSFPDLPYLELMEKNLSQIIEGFTAHAGD